LPQDRAGPGLSGQADKLMIAFPAGGPTDLTMRQLADNAGKILASR
jgi:tripartite-type tricarboxylate transporter receptor subunit TctC